MTIGRKLTCAFGAMLAGAVLLTVVSQATVQILRRELAGAVTVLRGGSTWPRKSGPERRKWPVWSGVSP